tara:strand:- start:1778 stop:1957 length:180 start_codon:yes stop_codon:yes gene_type:complete
MLVDYLERRIEALELNNKILRDNEVVLTTYIYELLDKDLPEQYKDVIKQEVFNPETKQI